ncbi:MAG: hypothetical protein ACKV0T_20155 [Planctomycetales bacterium]
MMTVEHEGKLGEDRLLDLLVDGELDASRRRELLQRLDREPDGWRRCALAFLEAQAWKCDLPSAAEAGWKSRGAVATNPVSRGRRLFPRLRRVSLAIGVLLAFGMGWLLRGEPLRESLIGSRPSSPSVELSPTPTSQGALASADQDAAAEPDAEDAEEPSGGLHLAGTLRWKGENDEDEMEIAVLAGGGVDWRWLMWQPPAVQQDVVQALERRGHRVQLQRQLMSVSLKNGEQVVVPVDQVQVRPAARVFQ